MRKKGGLLGIEKELGVYVNGVDPSRPITCFTIANTAKKAECYYFTPIRYFDGIQVCGVVVTNSIEARQFARLVDGKFSYIAVDSEKKIEPQQYSYSSDLGNIEGEVLDVVKQSKLINFKANDVTVDTVDIFLSNKLMGTRSRKIAIVGVGNIGFKLVLKLVERGGHVNMFRRNSKKLKVQAECINLTKPRGTLARAHLSESLHECLLGANAIVATADSSNIICLNDLKHAAPDAFLIDCGKACFCEDVYASRNVFRTDVTMCLLYHLKMVIMSHNFLFPKYGRKIVDNKTYVCGVCGNRGDIVLSDLNDFDSAIGICDGKGGLIRE